MKKWINRRMNNWAHSCEAEGLHLNQHWIIRPYLAYFYHQAPSLPPPFLFCPLTSACWLTHTLNFEEMKSTSPWKSWKSLLWDLIMLLLWSSVVCITWSNSAEREALYFERLVHLYISLQPNDVMGKTPPYDILVLFFSLLIGIFSHAKSSDLW